MNEEQETTVQPAAGPDSHHSVILGVSVRGWIAIFIVLTVCGMSWMKLEIKEPLYTLAGLVIGFYFAQATNKKPMT